MSAAPHDDHAFDGEPVTELPPDEPRTPGWLTGLGVALLFSAAVFFMASGRGETPEAVAPAAPEKPAPAVVAAPPPAAPAAAAAPRGAPDPADAARARDALQRSPEQMKLIQDRLDQIRKQRAAGGAPAPAAPAPPPAAPPAP